MIYSFWIERYIHAQILNLWCLPLYCRASGHQGPHGHVPCWSSTPSILAWVSHRYQSGDTPDAGLCQWFEDLFRLREAPCPEDERQIERERERTMTLGNGVTFFSLDFVADCVDFPLCFSVFAVYSTSWTSQKWDRSRPAGERKYFTLRWNHTWLYFCAFKFPLVAGYCMYFYVTAQVKLPFFFL